MTGIVGQLALVVQPTGTKPASGSRAAPTATPTLKTWGAAHRRQGAAVSYAKPR